MSGNSSVVVLSFAETHGFYIINFANVNCFQLSIILGSIDIICCLGRPKKSLFSVMILLKSVWKWIAAMIRKRQVVRSGLLYLKSDFEVLKNTRIYSCLVIILIDFCVSLVNEVVPVCFWWFSGLNCKLSGIFVMDQRFQSRVGQLLISTNCIKVRSAQFGNPWITVTL